MKILKNTEQKNVELNKDYYNEEEIRKLLENETIFYIDDSFECSNNTDVMLRWIDEDVVFRISTTRIVELKVIVDDEGYYTTVAIDNDSNKYYVTL